MKNDYLQKQKGGAYSSISRALPCPFYTMFRDILNRFVTRPYFGECINLTAPMIYFVLLGTLTTITFVTRPYFGECINLTVTMIYFVLLGTLTTITVEIVIPIYDIIFC